MNITEMVGIVEEVGSEVTAVKVGDRVTVNVETFCGECFYCKNGYVNNCTSPLGGRALGKIEEAYRIFENKEDGVIKIAIYNE